MPLWLIVLLGIAIVLSLALVVGVRRPRSSEQELQPSTRAAPTGQAPLATTIQALTRNRATGKLEVRSGEQSCSLCFLWPGRSPRRCSIRRLTFPARRRFCGRRRS
jgi:outer membrane biogenesis lipoprotein LolB